MKYGFFELFKGSDIDEKVLNRMGLIFFGLFAIGILVLIVVETKAEIAISQNKRS